jgi:hypothetical protein
VPGTSFDQQEQQSWQIAYVNSGGTPSVADVRVRGKHATIELRVHTWGAKSRRSSKGRRRSGSSWAPLRIPKSSTKGQLGIYPKFRAGVRVAGAMERLEKEHRVGTLAWLAFKADSARLTCSAVEVTTAALDDGDLPVRELHRRLIAQPRSSERGEVIDGLTPTSPPRSPISAPPP